MCALPLLLNVYSLVAQDTPSSEFYELYELLARARNAFEERQLERSFTLYLEALKLQRPLPEAEFGIASVYHAEGALEAAEHHYLRAIEQRQHARSEEFAAEVGYQLASLYQQEERWNDYETALLQITATESLFTLPQYSGQRTAMRNLLTSQGFDRLAVLYRLLNYHTLEAHAMLGIHYVRSGNYSPAVLHLLFATLKKIEYTVEAIRNSSPAYQFKTVPQLVSDSRVYPGVAPLLQRGTDLYQLLYYSAAAILGDTPNSVTWREIWQIVVATQEEGVWKRRAEAQLKNPQLEPLLEFVR